MPANNGSPQPLQARRVLITRPAGQAGAFARALRARGAEPILAPVTTIEPPDDARAAQRAVDELKSFAWLVFTSRNGVDAFFARLEALRADARYVGSVKVAAIGPKTAQRLRHFGIRADLTPAEFVGEDVARTLIGAAKTGDRVLIYRAQEARDVLPHMLADAGLETTVVAAYRATLVHDPHFATKAAQADVLTFASAGAVRGFTQLLGGDGGAQAAALHKTVACIGPVAADAARARGLRVHVVAGTYTTRGLIDSLEAYFATPR